MPNGPTQIVVIFLTTKIAIPYTIHVSHTGSYPKCQFVRVCHNDHNDQMHVSATDKNAKLYFLLIQQNMQRVGLLCTLCVHIQYSTTFSKHSSKHTPEVQLHENTKAHLRWGEGYLGVREWRIHTHYHVTFQSR